MPLYLNWTPAVPTLSEALAVTVIVKATVSPDRGEVMATVGGIVSLWAWSAKGAPSKSANTAARAAQAAAGNAGSLQRRTAFMALPAIYFSPAVYPRRIRHGQRPDLIPAFGLDRTQDHHRVIAIGIYNPFNPAFDVRRQVGQYRRGCRALRKRFSVDSFALRVGRVEKPPGDVLLPVTHDVQNCAAAFHQASEHIAFPAHRRHDQRRLEGRLRDPTDRRRPVAVFAPRGQNVHPVREHAERFLSRLRVHRCSPSFSAAGQLPDMRAVADGSPAVPAGVRRFHSWTFSTIS